MVPYTDSATFNSTVYAAEVVRQNAMSASGLTQATAKAADIVFLKACAQAAIKANISPAVWMSRLRDLGQTGV
jgi:hypothetical protein